MRAAAYRCWWPCCFPRPASPPCTASGATAAPDAEGDLDIGNTVLLHQPQSGSLWLVQYRGTYWQAEAPFPAQAGQAARIAGKSGNILILQPLEEN